MQLGGSGTRVRSSPFNGGAAAQQPQATKSVAQQEEDDFFSGWDTDPAPAPAARAPVSAPGFNAPPSMGYGIKPPAAQGYGIQPPSAQGYGIQPPASQGQVGMQPQQQFYQSPAPQMQQQQQQFPDQAQWQQPQQPQQQFGYDQAATQQPSQMQNQPQFQQQMGNLATSMAFSAMSGGGMGDPNVQNMILQQGSGIAQNALRNSGFASWFPNFFRGVQMQFNVTHSFVVRKLLLLLCPFPKQDSGSPEQQDSMNPFKVNTNEPDLYIPLMSFVSYCLLYCVQRGILSEFKPEVLGTTFSFAMVLYLVEVLAAKFGFFVAGSPVPVLELMGNCGYKFVHTLIMVLIRIASESSYIYYPMFLYLAACSSYAVYRFMISFAPNPNSSMQQQPQYGQYGQQQQYGQYGGQPQQGMLHKHIVLALALSQIFLCWLLTPSTSGQVAAPITSAAAASAAAASLGPGASAPIS